ncbi:MAG: PIN domain-containing protein [Candidatus Aenigmatarchaeota archaeon]
MLKKERKNKMSVYLDTNILQGALSRRNKEDIILFQRLKENNIKCYTSILTLMELLDIAKDRKFLIKLIVDRYVDVNTFLSERRKKSLSIDDLKEISENVNNLFAEYNFIEFINIKEDDWNLVKKIGENSNLHSSDVVHLVTAWVGGCQFLITHDEQFVEEGNKILKQEGVFKKLKVFTPQTLKKYLGW